MTLWPCTTTWQPYLILWLLLCGFPAHTIVFSHGDPHCSSTFQVWQPGQDAQRMIRELYLKMDNVTSYTKYQVAEIRAHLAGEISRINNWTFAVDKRVFEMQINRMDDELTQMKYTTGSSRIQGEIQHTTRRVDDLEKVVYGIRSKLRNIGGGSLSPRKNRLHDTHQRQQDVSEDLGQNLKNRIGDLTAEWVLLKRNVVGLEKEDRRHRKQIQFFINETIGLKSAVDYVSSVNKDLQEKNLDLTIQQSEIKERMGEIASGTQDVQTALDEFKAQNKETILKELQMSTTKLQGDLDMLRARLDAMEVAGRTKSKQEDTVSTVLTESAGRYHVGSINLNGADEEVIRGPSKQPSTLHVFKDCHDVYKAGFHISSVYDIFPVGVKYRVPVYCYMANGTGHTLIQRRVDGTINFNRRWMEYQQGFGNPYGEIWAGNELIHRLSKQKRYVLRVDLWDWEGEQFYAEYSKFRVDGKEDHYRIHVSGYSGDAGDSFSYHDKMAFSTEDMDNDLHPRNCAAENKGGWWYNSCFYSQLNGLYHTGWYAHTQSKYADGVAWFTLKDDAFYSVKKVEMTIKPLEM